MSDERRRARDRAAALGDPQAEAAAGAEACRLAGHAVSIEQTRPDEFDIVRDVDGQRWHQVFFSDDDATEVIIRLNCSDAFRDTVGGVAMPDETRPHGSRWIRLDVPCPRCGVWVRLGAVTGTKPL